jgi:putative DNA primase/helicase
MTQAIYDAAKQYTEKLNWIVHPLSGPKSNGPSPGKMPITKDWSNRTELATDDKLYKWFKNTDNNIGVVTGQKSNLTIIDVDDLLFFNDLIEGVDTSEWLVAKRTDDRCHLFFKFDSDLKYRIGRKIDKTPLAGIDVLSENEKGGGGNVVLPPSVHVTGQKYRFNKNLTGTDDIPDVPDEVKQRLLHIFKVEEVVYAVIRRCRKWVWEFFSDPEILHGGDGRRMMLALIAEMKANGLKEEGILFVSKLVYREDFDVDKSKSELGYIDSTPWKSQTLIENFPERCNSENTKGEKQKDSFDDIYNAIESVTIPEKRADRTTLAIRLFDAYCEPNKTLIEDIIMDEMAKDWEFNKSKAEDIAKEVVKRHKEREKEQKQKEAEFNKPESVDAEGCLHIVTDENPVFITRETLEYYWYSNGYFKRLGQRKNALPIREKIRRGYIEITGEQPPTELIESTLTLMQDMLYVEKTNLTPNKDKICLKNGVYDLNKKKLLPHDPEYKFRAQIPVKYNPHARCPEIMAFFDSMVDRDIISREDVQGLIEWFGYCLVPDNKFQKAVFMIGEKGSGKTTVTNLFNDFIGIENISGESLQKLEEDRFSVARIEDKLANTCPDISSKTIYDSQIFKAITGGDRLRGERKGIDAFEFQNTARLMFAANEPPHIHKSRDAFFRRVLSVTFKKTIPEKERDKDLIERITTEEELSGLLNVALQAREELYNRGGFINEKTLEETEREYSALSEPVVLFADECLVEGDYTSKHDIYSFYRDVWCTVHGLKPEKEQTFKKQLRHFVGIEEASRYDDDGNRRPRGYATDLIGHQEFVEMIQAKHGSHPTSDQLTTNLKKRYAAQLNQLETDILDSEKIKKGGNIENKGNSSPKNKSEKPEWAIQVGQVGQASDFASWLKLVKAGYDIELPTKENEKLKQVVTDMRNYVNTQYPNHSMNDEELDNMVWYFAKKNPGYQSKYSMHGLKEIATKLSESGWEL